MRKDTAERLSTPSVLLHWIVAIGVIVLLASGKYMTNTEDFSIAPIHKSIGVIVAIFVLLQVWWRLKNGWPPPSAKHNRVEHLLARIVHYALIIATVLMPLSGMLMSVMGGRGLYIFGGKLIGRNPNPDNPDRVLPINETLAEFGHETHEVLAQMIFFFLLLHIVGALKHHFFDKDRTLKRILGMSK